MRCKWHSKPVPLGSILKNILLDNGFEKGDLTKEWDIASPGVFKVSDAFINSKRVADKGTLLFGTPQYGNSPLRNLLIDEGFTLGDLKEWGIKPKPVLMKKVYKIGGFIIVAIRKRVGNKAVEAIGIAIRSPKDEDNRERGIMIAEGRAMKALDLKWRGRAIINRFMG
jgi:hypothetical protein